MFGNLTKEIQKSAMAQMFKEHAAFLGKKIDFLANKETGVDVGKAINVQTSTLKQVFTTLNESFKRLEKPEVKVDLVVDNSDVVGQLKKMGEFKATDMEDTNVLLNLIYLNAMENQPERFSESFDAFGKAVLELKPKDQVTINPKQIEGLMMAINNSGSPGAEAPNGGLYSGRKVVAVAGTAEKLNATKERCENITITAESDNSGIIALGDVNVVAAEGSEQGVILTPLGSHTVKVGDLSKIYIDATVSGDGVSFAYER